MWHAEYTKLGGLYLGIASDNEILLDLAKISQDFLFMF